MTHLQLALGYDFNYICHLIRIHQTALPTIDKYLVIFTDTATLKEDFLNCNKRENFSYGLVSCIIDLIHGSRVTGAAGIPICCIQYPQLPWTRYN